MVITPMYSFIVSFFISLFGNHLYVMHIINSIIISLIFLILSKKLGYYVFLLLPLLLDISMPGYNIFTLFLIVILVNLLENKNSDIILGIVVSFLFLTKQNVGLVFLISLFYCSKNKFKSLISFFIPISIFIFYLFLNNAFFSFINYCFLGLFDFGNNNVVFQFLPVFLIICLLLLLIFIKSDFKDYFCLIALCYQVIAYPIFNHAHFGLSFFIFCYYIILKLNIIKFFKNNKKIFFLFIFCCIVMVISLFLYPYNFNFNNLTLYKRNNSFLNGRITDEIFNEELTMINEDFEDILSRYDYCYFFSAHAYLVKLELGIRINSFDLINNGNIGYKGDMKIIEDVDNFCSNHSCLFVLDSFVFEGSQLNKKIIKYVKDEYEKVDVIGDFDFYDNCGEFYEK